MIIFSMDNYFEYRQLNNNYFQMQPYDTSSRDIAQLIWDTDEYIYPSIFNSEEDALTILSDLLCNYEDTMFSCKNIPHLNIILSESL